MNSKTASTRANSPVRKARIATIEIEVTAFLGIAQRSRGGGACQNDDQECGEEDRGVANHNTKVWAPSEASAARTPIAGNDEILDLLVGIAGLQQFPYEHAQI